MPSPIGTIAAEPGRKVFPFLSFLVVLVAVAISCGGSSPTAAPTPKPAVAAQTPLDVLKRSTEAMEAVKNFRAHARIWTCGCWGRMYPSLWT